MELSEYMKALRDDMGVTLAYVCNRINISISHLHDIENGNQKRPKIEVLQKLAGFYGVSLDKLIILSGKIPPDVYWKIVNNPELLDVVRSYEV